MSHGEPAKVQGGTKDDPELTTPTTPDQPVLKSSYSVITWPQMAEPRKKCSNCLRKVQHFGKKSLFGAMQEHAGSSLFNRPAYWTDLHAQVLNATYTELPPCNLPQPVHIPGSPPAKGHLKPSRTIMDLSDALTEILDSNTTPTRLNHATQTTLKTFWPSVFGTPVFMPDLNLVFGDKLYPNVARVHQMWTFKNPNCSHRSSQSSLRSITTLPSTSFNVSGDFSQAEYSPVGKPMMCYLNKNLLASMRGASRLEQRPADNPVGRLMALRSKRYLPADPNRDPVLIAVFLAMAQHHFYRMPLKEARRNEPWLSVPDIRTMPFKDLKLRILSSDCLSGEFFVYTATVTAQFLERFRHPKKTPALDLLGRVPGIKIEFTRVPVWPILGLRERLGQGLGMDLVGVFDPTVLTTWEEEVEDKDANLNPFSPRKRKALSEFLDSFRSSSDEDLHSSDIQTSESDSSDQLSPKRRCLKRGLPVVGPV